MCLLRLIQIEAKKGDNIITKSELIDWNQAVGISRFPIDRSVKSRAKRLNDDPACSNPAQNRTEAIHISRIADNCMRSFILNFPNVKIPVKYIKNNNVITNAVY